MHGESRELLELLAKLYRVRRILPSCPERLPGGTGLPSCLHRMTSSGLPFLVVDSPGWDVVSLEKVSATSSVTCLFRADVRPVSDDIATE